ncbi:MAG TPA: hypothetical protein VH912_10500 [Streptosporangiaceae bacterium]
MPFAVRTRRAAYVADCANLRQVLTAGNLHADDFGHLADLRE